MVSNRTVRVESKAGGCPHDLAAPRLGVASWDFGLSSLIVFAAILMTLAVTGPAAGVSLSSLSPLDQDGNGREDALDHWLQGHESWEDLRQRSAHGRNPDGAVFWPAEQVGDKALPTAGDWSAGAVRLICLGGDRGALAEAGDRAAKAGSFRVIHDLDHFGGVQVLSLDEDALRAFLERSVSGRLVLDREGRPALADSRWQVGADQAAAGPWQLGEDWSATVAILDSGCDTAHGDLGDYGGDNADGPAPAVGDDDDWYPASEGWPLFEGYRVVGWHDVTDDFPQSQGPWDYYYHGTALASVVAGSGSVDPALHGLNPGGRLTVVKFYDFDEVWHTWAGDFLAACAWTLENRDQYRVRCVLAAVNWEEDLGLSEAMDAFLDVGIVPVVAMGNFGSDPAGPGYPAILPRVLTVGSTDPDGAVSSFSGQGLSGQDKPDLVAPGGAVTAADNEPDDTYSTRQGTSLAAAHVAGAVFMLEEALQDNAIHLPNDAQAALTRMALLKGTAARVTPLVPAATSQDGPDLLRGWGGLRVDAALQAALVPLFPGADQLDTLSQDFQRPVIGRRLVLSPGIRYLVEAVPEAGLDIALSVVDPGQLADDPGGDLVLRSNVNEAGVSEFLYVHAQADSWVFLAVQEVEGAGQVTLRVREADTFAFPSSQVTLPGDLTGAANFGQLTPSSDRHLVIPSRVSVDHLARSINVFDTGGNLVTGWPVFFFPRVSAQGGISQPVVWNLDGSPGDEIAASSDYGSVYFLNRLGAWWREDLAFNVELTTLVGLERADGLRQVATLDEGGKLRAWSWGPQLELETSLGIGQPLDPAVGQLVAGAGDELVVAFRGGQVLVTDALGNIQPGWPVDLGVSLENRPVLCDLDEDGLHEIIIPDLDPAGGTIRVHVLRGDGQPGPGDGEQVAPPGGGRWFAVSDAAVVGRYGTGDLRVSFLGLVDNGLEGARNRWRAATCALTTQGSVWSELLAGLEVRATTAQGVLDLQHARLATPTAWDFLGGTGTEPAFMFDLRWSEILYGLTDIPGSSAGWLQPTMSGRPLAGTIPLRLGGAGGQALTVFSSVHVPLGEGISLRGQLVDDRMNLWPVSAGHSSSQPWFSERADQRNSGAYPLPQDMSPVVEAPSLPFSDLSVFPNPGRGRFRFSLGTQEGQDAFRIQVYDLRGRRIRDLNYDPAAKSWGWDGRDQQGRRVAAGTYFAVARQGHRQLSARFVLTR